MSSLRQKFNKAVLIGVMGVAALTGIAGNAQAQDRGYPQPVTVTQTQQQQDIKPWENDPQYIQQINTIEQQSALRMSTFNARMAQQKAQLDNWHSQQINREIIQGQRTSQINHRNKQGGWSFGQILTTASGAGAIEQQYATRLTIIQNQSRAYALQEHNRVITLEQNLDNQYANKYLRADQLAQRQAALQQRANAGGQTQANNGGTLTPDQMHDQLVKAYQQKVLANAKAGKALPDPGQFGLEKNDPAIQIGGPGANR